MMKNIVNFSSRAAALILLFNYSLFNSGLSSASEIAKNERSVWTIKSPSKVITVEVQTSPIGALKYRVLHNSVSRDTDSEHQESEPQEVVAWSALGLELSWMGRDDPKNIIKADFGSTITFESRADSVVDERYEMLSGKRRDNRYIANESRLSFKDNETGRRLRLDIQAADDGFAMRYVLTDQSPLYHSITREDTSFNIGLGGEFWGQPYDVASLWTPAYETPYLDAIPIGTSVSKDQGTGWGFPSLFAKDNGLFVLLHESNLTRQYHGSHLLADASSGNYKVAFPLADSAQGFGKNVAATRLPATLPWRYMVIDSKLSTILESNRVFDLAGASAYKNVDWIKPGIASWSWLSDHPSSRDINKLKTFIDFAAQMQWPYSLMDANWNLISDSSMQDLVAYADVKGVGLSFWYNSGGRNNFVTEEPRNIMDDTDRRREEFARLQSLGVKAVKVDFFHSDKQDVIAQYIDILEDAAAHQIMVVFHGSTVPRGWERTYPNLMSMESVRGAEAYTFPSSPNYAELALYQNTILPFTRNVIGSMDYTPVVFGNYHTPRITSNAHEAALGVIFESGIQHLADSVNSYNSLKGKGPEYLAYLKSLPASWDETRFILGYPGKEVVLARRSGNVWYIAGINGEKIDKNLTLDLSFLGQTHEATMLVDGEPKSAFTARKVTLSSDNEFVLSMKSNGGFVMIAQPQ